MKMPDDIKALRLCYRKLAALSEQERMAALRWLVDRIVSDARRVTK